MDKAQFALNSDDPFFKVRFRIEPSFPLPRQDPDRTGDQHDTDRGKAKTVQAKRGEVLPDRFIAPQGVMAYHES